MITLAATVGIAFAGYLATYVNGLRLAQRQAQLLRVNQQLGEFYGPLLALIETNMRTYQTFTQAGLRSLNSGLPATEEERAEWRTWATSFFIPNVQQMRTIVVEKTDLLVEESIPPELLQLCAHVAGYEIIAAQWSRGIYDYQHKNTPFPGPELLDYCRGRFAELKADQTRFLGRERRSRWPLAVKFHRG